MRAFLTLCAVSVLAFGVSNAFGSPSAATDGSCVVTGATWKFGARTGTKYVVRTRGPVTCAFVKTWVPRLSGQHRSQIGGTGKLTGGPAGWMCLANGIQASGTCYAKANPGQAFVWIAKR